MNKVDFIPGTSQVAMRGKLVLLDCPCIDNFKMMYICGHGIVRHNIKTSSVTCIFISNSMQINDSATHFILLINKPATFHNEKSGYVFYGV